jgi:hypothetical protein
MGWGIVIGVVALGVPLSSGAQSVQHTLADMEEALRQRQMICAGMLDVGGRSAAYSGHQVAQCFVILEAQRAEYQRFKDANAFSSRLSGAASAPIR